MANALMRALVAGRRVIRVLELTPDVADPTEPVRLPDRGDLVDPVSGIRVRDGRSPRSSPPSPTAPRSSPTAWAGTTTPARSGTAE